MSSVAHWHEVVDNGHLSLGYMLNLIPLVILYYDYTLTFSREVESFWPHQNRVGFASSIYFLNRYVAIFGHIPIVLRHIPSFEPFFINGRCRSMHHYVGYLGMVLQFLVAILCATRVYALYNKNHCIFTGLIALVIASIAVGFAALSIELGEAHTAALYPGFHGCNFDLGLSDEGGRFLSIAWSGIMTFDIIVFALTLYKAITVGYNVPLIQVIILDGSLYFFVLFFVNLANILMLQFAPTLLKSFGTQFTNVLSTTLVSRTMLRLRSDDTRHHGDSRVTEQTTDVSFVPTLSQLSGGLPSVPTTMTGFGNEEDLELKRL